MKQRLFWLMLWGLLALPAVTWAWDGKWTSGRSGEFLYDPEDSTGKSGVPNAPQVFPRTPSRDYADVDPEELDDYFLHGRRVYAPYALARVTQELRYNSKIVISPGYYLIKAGDFQDGSPNKHSLPRENGAPNPADPLADKSGGGSGSTTIYKAPSKKPFYRKLAVPALKRQPPSRDPNAPSGQSDTDSDSPIPDHGMPRVFVIKRQGKVIAVVPIHHAETYIPSIENKHKPDWLTFNKRKRNTPNVAAPKKEAPPKDEKPDNRKKIPPHALAWVEMEERRPVLKFYYHHMIYSTTFQ